MGAIERLYAKGLEHNNNLCGLLNKSYKIEDYVKLIFGQAKLFCLREKFPSIQIWNELDSEYQIQRYNIFVDKKGEEIILDDANDKILVIGGTLSIKCEKLRPYRIILMHGAEVFVKGDNHAIIYIEDDGSSKYESELHNGAIIVKL